MYVSAPCIALHGISQKKDYKVHDDWDMPGWNEKVCGSEKLRACLAEVSTGADNEKVSCMEDDISSSFYKIYLAVSNWTCILVLHIIQITALRFNFNPLSHCHLMARRAQPPPHLSPVSSQLRLV